MILKNYEDRLDFLNRNIDKINKSVSDFLGLDVNLEVRAFQYGTNKLITLRDYTNIRKKCGVLSNCFEVMYLSDCGIRWNNDSVSVIMDCICQSISGDEYDITICTVSIVGDEVSVRSAD